MFFLSATHGWLKNITAMWNNEVEEWGHILLRRGIDFLKSQIQRMKWFQQTWCERINCGLVWCWLDSGGYHQKGISSDRDGCEDCLSRGWGKIIALRKYL
jgi:hypothetical protein